MNNIKWTEIQFGRLKALGAGYQTLESGFDTHSERDQVFQQVEKKLVRNHRAG